MDSLTLALKQKRYENIYMENVARFLIEIDKLKSVYRDSNISDLSRRENSAEHSWHVALALLTISSELNIDLDILKALKMALIHDIGEIGAGDTSIYSDERVDAALKEQRYIKKLSKMPLAFAEEARSLWEEFESQVTLESRIVKVMDRFLPFLLHLATSGKYWKENSISKSQVVSISEIVRSEIPEMFEWMTLKLDAAIESGWLRDS